MVYFTMKTFIVKKNAHIEFNCLFTTINAIEDSLITSLDSFETSFSTIFSSYQKLKTDFLDLNTKLEHSHLSPCYRSTVLMLKAITEKYCDILYLEDNSNAHLKISKMKQKFIKRSKKIKKRRLCSWEIYLRG